MTDITELAQREKFEAWVMTQICISKSTLEGLRTADGYRNSTLSGSDYNLLWNLWKAAGAELVEALEKAQQVDEELCRLLPPGAEYMDPPDGGDVTPLEGVRRMVADYRQRIAELREWNAGLAQESFERQQRISELLEGKVGNALLERENHHVEVVGKLAERIAELEESHAQVIQSRDHYKRITEEGLRRLAESRTVKLPKLKMLEDYLAEVAIEERKQILVGVKLEFHRELTAAGIKVEAE